MAFYTETFHEFCRGHSSWLKENLTFDNQEYTEEFLGILEAMWGTYEIIGETEDEEKVYLKDTFEQYKKYYTELIDNYNVDFDWQTDGITRSVSTTGSTVSTSSGKDSELHIDLPNKVVAEGDYEKYPSSVDIRKPGSIQTVTPNTSVVYSNTEDFITRKREYLNQIRNIMAEFSTRFYDCFLGVFL